jgi:hypothetical protein
LGCIRELDIYDGATSGPGGDGDGAAGEAGPLLHAGEANAGAVAGGGFVEALAVVGNGEMGAGERKAHLRGFGMFEDVAERFLGDAVQHELQVPGQFRGREGQVDGRAAAFEEQAALGFESGRQTEVIEHRGMELAGEAVDVVRDAGDLFLDALVAEVGGGDGDGGQALREIVVEFAGDAAALVFLRAHQAAGQKLQL